MAEELPEEELSKEEKRAAKERFKEISQQWFTDHWSQDRRCPICGTTEWGIADSTFQLSGRPEYDAMGKAIPVVAALCKNCGYTVLFNAIAMGLQESTLQDEDEES